MPRTQAHVIVDGTRRIELDESDTLWFGREDSPTGTVGLDPADLGISRIAGSIQRAGETWTLTNRSSAIPLYLDLETGHAMRRLLPGHHHVINDRLVIVVKGLRRLHRIDLIACPGASAATVAVGGDTKLGVESLTLTEGELDALTAIFRGFLVDFPRRDCIPLSYSEAGGLLGLPGSTIRKRIEKVRSKLSGSGVYVEGPNARWMLADIVLDATIISADDLARLDRPRARRVERSLDG